MFDQSTCPKRLAVVVCMCLQIIQLVLISTSAFDEVVKYCNSSSEDNSRPGICISFERKLTNCPPLQKLLKERNFDALRATFCEGPDTPKDISWVKVCCPIEDLIVEPEEDYEKHPNYKLIPKPDNSYCGQSQSFTFKIVGGRNADPGELPWLARIGVQREDDDIVEFTCGGSIISSRYILTASHCFKDKREKLVLVRLGETNEDEEEDCLDLDGYKICGQVEDYEPEELIIHPEYNGQAGSQNDIALIRLNQEIKNLTSIFTRPICLPFATQFNLPPLQISPSGTALNKTLVAGWGKLKNSANEGSSILQLLSVPVKQNFECGIAFRPNNITISEKQLCAGGDKGKGSCSGDSGGPLTYLSTDRSMSRKPRQYQIGIVSFGKSQCAAGNAPVVYTRVKKFLSWMLDNMKE